MFSNKVAAAIQELLTGNGYTVYYIDQIPSYDQNRNLDGFIAWDVEEIKPLHCTEGVGYSDAANAIVLNFNLSVIAYGSKLTIRNSIETALLNRLQPLVSARRVPLKSYLLTNAFVRYMVWSSTTEYPIPKTGQSNAEMSASVLMFNSFISVLE